MSNCKQHKHCISHALAEGEQICAEHGQRFTPIRRRVLELVWQSHKPAKAYDILDKLGKNTGAPKPPTVYRALDFLLENGLIHKINSLNAFVGCTHPARHHQCYFLICQQCGEITECCTPALADAIDSAAAQYDFTPETAVLEIQGICKACRDSAAQ
ncbi:MAG: transcriptional repressor [Gammaproteobacteria bacterium]|nr:transcriptional repressor [Gammaproteobacteria bacterium]